MKQMLTILLLTCFALVAVPDAHAFKPFKKRPKSNTPTTNAPKPPPKPAKKPGIRERVLRPASTQPVVRARPPGQQHGKLPPRAGQMHGRLPGGTGDAACSKLIPAQRKESQFSPSFSCEDYYESELATLQESGAIKNINRAVFKEAGRCYYCPAEKLDIDENGTILYRSVRFSLTERGYSEDITNQDRLFVQLVRSNKDLNSDEACQARLYRR